MNRCRRDSAEVSFEVVGPRAKHVSQRGVRRGGEVAHGRRDQYPGERLCGEEEEGHSKEDVSSLGALSGGIVRGFLHPSTMRDPARIVTSCAGRGLLVGSDVGGTSEYESGDTGGAGECMGVGVRDFKSPLLDQEGNVAVQMTSPRDCAPGTVEAMLPALDSWIGGETVLTEEESSRGFHDPSHLSEGLDGGGESAQREREEQRVDRVRGESDVLHASRMERDWDRLEAGGSLVACEHFRRRIQRMDVGDLFGIVEGEIEAGARAHLEDDPL